MLPVFFLATVIPISLLIWIINVSLLRGSSAAEAVDPISPARCLMAVMVPVIGAKLGLKKKSLDVTGAVAGLLVGFVLTVSSYCFIAGLMVFFIFGSKVTKFRAHLKQKYEENFKEGGQRNWMQVVCNGGVATELAILYMMEAGCGERPVDFSSSYGTSWLNMAVLGALACSCGDTFASEIGTVVGTGQPRLITTLEKVPRGTNGGVSVVGTLASGLGGALVGVAYYLALVLCCQADLLFYYPPQLQIVGVGALAGLLGSLFDSLLGAIFQYSGYDRERKCIVENPGPDVEYICGSPVLDNHSVNLLSSLLTAMLTPYIALALWASTTA